MVRDINAQSYGDRQDFAEIQSGAKMAPAPGVGSAATAPSPESLGLAGLDAPSALPGQPVTQGASLGPGAGPEILGLGGDPFTQSAQHWAKDLPVLEALANRPGVDPIVRKLVNRLKARL